MRWNHRIRGACGRLATRVRAIGGAPQMLIDAHSAALHERDIKMKPSVGRVWSVEERGGRSAVSVLRSMLRYRITLL